MFSSPVLFYHEKGRGTKKEKESIYIKNI